jgi:hypothetical protein
MALTVYLTATNYDLLPFNTVGTPPPPPPPPYDVYLDGTILDLDQFGVTSGGQPYYDTVAVTGGDEAVFDVDGTTDRPYLEG